MDVGTLRAKLTLDSSQFDSGVDKGISRASKLDSSFLALGTAAAGAAAAIAATGAVIGAKLGKSAIQGASDLEQQEVAFKTLLGSAEEASSTISQIVEDAKKTPFELSGLIEGNKKLIAAGVSAKDARVDFLALGTAVSAVGGGSVELDRLASNLQQIKATGKAATMDIRQFGNAGIPIFGLLADSMGVAESAVAGLVEEGKVGYAEVTQALKDAAAEGGRFEGAMENQSKTFAGVMSNIKDSFNVTLTAIARDSGLFDSVKQAAERLLTILQENQETIEAFGQKIFSFVTTSGQKLLDFIFKAIDFIQRMKKQFDDFVARLEEMGILDIVREKINELITNIKELTSRLSGNEAAFSALIKLITTVGIGALLVLVETLNKIVQAITKVIDYVSWLKDSFSSLFELSGQAYEIGKGIVDGIINGITSGANAIVESMKNIAYSAIDAAKNALGINSPSKVFMDIGKNTAIGFEEGISSMPSGDMLKNAITNQASISVKVTGNTVQNDAALADLITQRVQGTINQSQELNQLFGGL